MPIDREQTLKRAEKLLRQGRLEAAIAEYGQVVAEYPRDWTTANLLGDLYVRAGQIGAACQQYARIAEHLAGDGFVAKAAALYKKVIKLNPSDEAGLLRSAELAAAAGPHRGRAHVHDGAVPAPAEARAIATAPSSSRASASPSIRRTSSGASTRPGCSPRPGTRPAPPVN